MTNDTLKSLGYLKRSLKMNYKAMGKNATNDGIDPSELVIFVNHSKAMYDQIELWEKANLSITNVPNVSSGVVQPVIQPVGGVSGVGIVGVVGNSSDDLLTID